MLKMTHRADLAVFYEADAVRYRDDPRRSTQVITQEVFCAFYADCPSVGFEMDGVPIGGVVFDGEQAHIAVLPQYHGRWALLLKPAVEWLFSLKREVIVEVERDNALCLRFMERNGWQQMRTTDEAVFYRLVPQGGARKTEYPFRGRPSTTHLHHSPTLEISPCFQAR